MNKQHITATIIILVVLLGVAGLSACASIASAEQKSGLEAQVNTAVAATLIQRVVETRVAEQSVAIVSEPEVQTQPTNTPLPTPTPTPVPTQPAQPTAAAPTEAAQPTPTAVPPAASGPTIIAEQNTNCRAGPGTGYTILAWFMEGDESTVEGRDSTKDWWYIVSPENASEHCWVWEGSTTVVGDTSTVPVVAAPAAPKTKTSSYWYYSCSHFPYGCTGYPYYTCKKAECVYQCTFCFPSQIACNANSFWYCNVYGYCTCKLVYKDPCKKSSCPPLTQVNYKKYCKNYPQCCFE
jgi:uncharacterized protein YgiM (DUF1202 family)